MEGSSTSKVPQINEEVMRQLRLTESGSMEPEAYPERPGEPDCAYYIRTGLCRFGVTCKFNHPANRTLADAASRVKGGYPERFGQPECEYYMRTGTCKFGATCKFHHPRDKAGISAQVQLNILGYPIRPNEKECAYYLRTGVCKFGSTCKFNHQQPSNAMFSLRGSPIYPPINSNSAQGQTYAGVFANWPMSRPSFVPSPSNYPQLIVPQGMVQVSGWNPYSSQENQQVAPTGPQGAYSSYRSGSIPLDNSNIYQGENIFPERPDQPECQFYMKTGDCKFGAVCKFHHPRERLIPIPNCVLSPLGLPLRPGEPTCVFYSRYGICKFGPNCKFNHPVGTFTYNDTTTSTALALSPEPQQLLSSNEYVDADDAHKA